MLSDRMRDAINEQINAEFYSAYLYLSMAAHCDALNLPGFSHWMKLQAKEEVEHATKFMEYLADRGARIVLKAIGEPPAEFPSPLAVFEQALEHERHVTALINNLYKMAVEDNDYATQSELMWFIKEQVEEEKNATQIVEQLKMVGTQGSALVLIDRYLASRSN
jgi:ferritin